MENDRAEKQLVIQSNPLVESQYKLNPLSQLLLRKLISMISPQDERFEKRFYRLTVKEFASLLEREENPTVLYREMKTIAEKLKKTDIKIIKQRSTIYTSWLASYEYHHYEGWIEFEFSAKLESELLQLKEQFTQYYLTNVSKLKSQYSIRLYELLKQYLPVEKRKIMVDDLRAMLGIEKDEHKQFGHLKQHVLDRANREINAKTDLDFQWKTIKHVRKIVGVEFYDIHLKNPITPELLELLPLQYRENKDVLDNIRKWLEIKGADYVSQKILYTVSRKPENFKDYLYYAFEKDYGAGYDPTHVTLPVETGKAVINPLLDGIKIEIEGVEYTIEDGFVRTEKGVIPVGQLRDGIQSGKFRIVDQECEGPFEQRKNGQ
jgi:hypothetical protein